MLSRSRSAAVVSVVLTALASAGIGLASPAHAQTTITTTVVRVSDGDTIRVADPIFGRDRIRILGIDSPETNDEEVECYGDEATDWANYQLLGQTVTLVSDPTQDDIDRYDRALAYVMIGDWDYSVEAARAGMARSDRFGVQRADRIKEAELEAQAAGRGLWGACPYQQP